MTTAGLLLLFNLKSYEGNENNFKEEFFRINIDASEERFLFHHPFIDHDGNMIANAGKMKVKGDTGIALKLQSLMG